MEKGLRECCRSMRIGKILIRRDQDTRQPRVRGCACVRRESGVCMWEEGEWGVHVRGGRVGSGGSVEWGRLWGRDGSEWGVGGGEWEIGERWYIVW